MKANNQDVTFKLIDGGNHALTNKENDMQDILDVWYTKH